MKKKTLIGIVAACAIAGVLALTGCGSNADQEAISKDLTSQLDSLKQGSIDKISNVVKKNATYLDTLSIDSDEFTKAYVDGLDYKIGDIKVDSSKGTATANVTLTTKTATTILPDFVTDVANAAGKLTVSDLTQEKLLKMVGEQLLTATKSAKGESTSVTVTYTKDKSGNWAMDDLETQLYKALGLDTINLDDICSQLGVSNVSELATAIQKYMS
jgi:outer membrane murein-binding lipoprotein Lpp